MLLDKGLLSNSNSAARETRSQFRMQGVLGNNQVSLEPRVFELPGEPAVVINGVPEIPMVSDTLVTTVDFKADAESCRNTGFGEWLEGREVRKLFGTSYYSGNVTEFDQETGWYRVVYEDGDFEDLEWHELQDILQPLDITVPLKSLALKIIRNSEKSESGRKIGGDRKRGAKVGSRRGRPRGNSGRI